MNIMEIDRIDSGHSDRARAAGAAMLQALEKALPTVAKHADEVEELGMAHPEAIAAIEQSGFFRSLVPLQYGGLECDPASFMAACIRLGAVCPATAWVACLVHVHSWQIALMDKRMQDEFWASGPDTRASSTYPPTGTVKSVEGGYLLSGSWHYSSGVDHAQWTLLGGQIVDAPDGVVEFRSFCVPASDLVVKGESWDVIGLKGTGSKTLVLDNVFVPEYRTHSASNVYGRTEIGFSENDRPLYRLPWLSIFYSTIAGVAVGTARGGVDRFVEATKSRVSFAGKGMQMAANPFVQLRIANALAEVNKADDRLVRMWDEMFDTTLRGEEPDQSTRLRSRFEGADCNASAYNALSQIMEMAGGGVLFAANPLQRYFRDLLGMRVHPTAQRELFGSWYVQHLLGVDLPPFDKGSMFSLLMHA